MPVASPVFTALLIALFGIETCWQAANDHSCICLLIALFGIETQKTLFLLNQVGIS